MILALNGSPRRSGNTATMLQSALAGAASMGMETRMVHLYQLQYKGCISCFSCKLKGGQHGRCAMKDELSPVLEMMQDADAIIFGSPIYYYNITPELLALLHRFMFSNMLYTSENRWQFKRRVPSGFIYTFGVPPEMSESIVAPFDVIHKRLGDMLGFQPEICCAANAWQFNDYSRYEADLFDAEAKKRYREEVFPKELLAAREMGIRLVQKLSA